MRPVIRALSATLCLSLAASGLPAQAIRLVQTPVRVLFPLAQPEPVKAAFDSLVGEKLREQGFELAALSVYDSLWLHFRDSIGGYYDPYTGHVVDSLFQTVLVRTRETLRTGFGAQAIVYVSLDVLNLPFGGGKVQWFGAEEESGGRGGLAGLVLGRSRGTIPGITLVVTAHDLAGQRLARRLGGVQLRERIKGGEFVEVPREELFADPGRMARAVRNATDSLPELIRKGLSP